MTNIADVAHKSTKPGMMEFMDSYIVVGINAGDHSNKIVFGYLGDGEPREKIEPIYEKIKIWADATEEVHQSNEELG